MNTATAFAIAAVTVSAPDWAHASTGTGAVAGRVVAWPTYGPPPYVAAALLGVPGESTISRDGTFVMRNVPAGTHTIRVWALAYSGEERTVVVTAGSTTYISQPFLLERLPVRLCCTVETFFPPAQPLTESIAVPRLPGTEDLLVGFSRQYMDLRSGAVRLNMKSEWAHDVPVTWEEIREAHLYNFRIERASVLWTEMRRNRLE